MGAFGSKECPKPECPECPMSGPIKCPESSNGTNIRTSASASAAMNSGGVLVSADATGNCLNQDWFDHLMVHFLNVYQARAKEDNPDMSDLARINPFLYYILTESKKIPSHGNSLYLDEKTNTKMTLNFIKIFDKWVKSYTQRIEQKKIPSREQVELNKQQMMTNPDYLKFLINVQNPAEFKDFTPEQVDEEIKKIIQKNKEQFNLTEKFSLTNGSLTNGSYKIKIDYILLIGLAILLVYYLNK